MISFTIAYTITCMYTVPMTRFHYANTKDPNMLYMLQHRISDPVFFLEHEGVKRVFLPSIELEAFKEDGNREVEVVDVGPLQAEAAKQEGDRTGSLALMILKMYGVVGAEIVVPDNFPISIADQIRKQALQLVSVTNWAPERLQKSPEEISAIKENLEYTKKAFEYIEQVLVESAIEQNTLIYKNKIVTSGDLKKEISKIFFDCDLVNSEGLIISCGAHAAMPHHSGEGPIRPNETIIVDIFPQSTKNHYFADVTRTYVKGKPSKEIMRMYDAVSKAEQAALVALRPGATTRSIYEVAATVIREHGFDVGEKGFIHSLGHGLGVAVHELPNLSPRSDEVLEPGHVITIEPGLYYPEWGGVRIEDTVVITEDGYEDLTNYPKNWLIP